MRTKHIIGDFEGFFEGAKTFLTLKLSSSKRRAILGSTKIPKNMKVWAFKWVLKLLNYSCLDSYMVRASAC
jgi:hypothetical protein